MYMMAKVVSQTFWCKGCPQRGHKPSRSGREIHERKKNLKKQEKQNSDFIQWKLNAACLKVHFLPIHPAEKFTFIFPLRRPDWVEFVPSSELPAQAVNEVCLSSRPLWHFTFCSASHIWQCWQAPGYSQPYQKQQLWTEMNLGAGLDSAGHTGSAHSHCMSSLGKLLHCYHSFLLHRQPQAAHVVQKAKIDVGWSSTGPTAVGPLDYLHQLMSTALPLPIPIHI